MGKRRPRVGIVRSFMIGYRGAVGPKLTHDQRYHRNRHRKHAAKNAWHTALGVVAIVSVLLCICAGCF